MKLELVLLVIVMGVDAGGAPPSISVPQGNYWSEPVAYIRSGTKRTFNCVAKGSLPLKYKWTVDGNPVKNTFNSVEFIESNGTLFIGGNFSKNESGNYSCVVSNIYGETMTPYLQLIRAESGNLFPGNENSPAENIQLNQYNHYAMVCKNQPSSIPPLEIKWEKGTMTTLQFTMTEEVQPSNRLVMQPDGTLHFLWLESTDSQYFRCSGTNPTQGMSVSNPLILKLNVQSGTGNSRSPEIKYNEDVTVMAGKDAKLTCIFSYYSKTGENLRIKWLRNQEELGSGTTLTLSKVKVPDDKQSQAGEYVCEASLGDLQPVRAKVMLKITSPPEFVPAEKPAHLSSPVDKDAMFHCRATSHNTHQGAPVWMINMKPLIGCPHSTLTVASQEKASPDVFPTSNSAIATLNVLMVRMRKTVQSPPALKASGPCNGACIPKDQTCTPLPPCEYPSFSCDQGKKCLPRDQICDGIAQCSDRKDEEGCAGKATIQRGKFRLNSQRTQLTIPMAQKTDVMCVQCLVSNMYGNIFGDGCLTVIGKIEITKAPNDTYFVSPMDEITIAIDATTYPDWQNQISYQWFWYMPVTTPTGDKIIEMQQLPPTSSYGKFFQLSGTKKELTFTIPHVDTTVMEENTTEYDLYRDLTNNRLFSIKISHKFDFRVVNFTVKGKELEKPNKIEITKAPNDTYFVSPMDEITIAIDATTDPDWQNQMSYQWFWYMPVTTPTGDKIIEMQQLPPTSSYGKFFQLSGTKKELTFTIPHVDTPVMEDNTAEYDLYRDLTNNRLFSIKISHKFDFRVVNFTVKGKELEKPKPVPNLWYIPLIIGILVVFIVVTLIICYMNRNRGGTYPLDRKEKKGGNNPEQELKENECHDVGRVDDFYDDSRDVETGRGAEERPLSSDMDDDVTHQYADDGNSNQESLQAHSKESQAFKIQQAGLHRADNREVIVDTIVTETNRNPDVSKYSGSRTDGIFVLDEDILHESPWKGPDYLHRCILGERSDDHLGNRFFICLNVDVESVKEFAVTVYVSSLCGHKALQLVGD